MREREREKERGEKKSLGYRDGKQAEVQPAETHPLYLRQFVFYGCVFVNKFI